LRERRREIERRLVEAIPEHGHERLALGRRAPKLGTILKIGFYDAPESTQALESVPLSLLFCRALFGRVLAVGDVLAQTLASSPGLGEPNPDAYPNPAACSPYTDAQAPTQARGRSDNAQAGHGAVNQLPTRLDPFDLHRLERRHTLRHLNLPKLGSPSNGAPPWLQCLGTPWDILTLHIAELSRKSKIL
jgi:hypothetical protein